MAILGSLIKGLINFRDIIVSEKDPVEAQNEELRSLLKKAKDTAFGEYYGFEEILNAEDPAKAFAEKIPFFNYNKINEEWWYKIHDVEEDVTWPGSPPYFARSSGTTGTSTKLIPVTEDLVESIRQTGIKQVGSLANYDLPSDFFEKEIMMLGSSTDLVEKEDHEVGEISGISASNIPSWFRGFYKPGVEIAQIEDWDKRVLEIAKEAKNWDIGAVSGIPGWTELMMKKVIEYNNVEHIHEIWPNFMIYTSGGVAFETYEKSFNQLLGHPITVIDTYLATEGFLAFQERPETDAMKLVLDNGIYFEFVPFKDEYIEEDGSVVAGAPVVAIGEVEKDKDYVLLVSTVSGLWRYVLGDTVKFTDVERKEIKITGRTKFFLNSAGEKITVIKMNEAVNQLEKDFNITIPEFTISVEKEEKNFLHTWYLGIEGDPHKNEQELTAALDKTLARINKSYASIRAKNLLRVEVKTIPLNTFYEWNAKNKKKGGQVKMEKVIKEDKFSEWKDFVEAHKTKA